MTPEYELICKNDPTANICGENLHKSFSLCIVFHQRLYFFFFFFNASFSEGIQCRGKQSIKDI